MEMGVYVWGFYVWSCELGHGREGIVSLYASQIGLSDDGVVRVSE